MRLREKVALVGLIEVGLSVMPPSARLIDPFELPYEHESAGDDFVFNLDVDPSDDEIEPCDDGEDFVGLGVRR